MFKTDAYLPIAKEWLVPKKGGQWQAAICIPYEVFLILHNEIKLDNKINFIMIVMQEIGYQESQLQASPDLVLQAPSILLYTLRAI